MKTQDIVLIICPIAYSELRISVRECATTESKQITQPHGPASPLSGQPPSHPSPIEEEEDKDTRRSGMS